MITGRNGAGKTSVLEAVAYLSTLQSFRGSPREALVRRGAERRHPPGRHPGGRTVRSPSKPSCRPPGGRGPWSTGRPSAGAAISTRPCGPRCSPPRTSGWSGQDRRSDGGSSTRPWPWSTRRRPGRQRTWRRSCVNGRRCCGRRAGSSTDEIGQHPRRVGRAPRRRRDGTGGGPRGPGRCSWPRSPTAHYSRLAGQADRGRARVPALVVGSSGRGPGRSRGRRTSSGGSR